MSRYCLFVILWASIATLLHAQSPHLHTSIQYRTGYWSGFTQYQIGASDHFPISQLTFPVHIPINLFLIDITRPSKWSVTLMSHYITGKTTGKMEDLDWGYDYLLKTPEAKKDTLDIRSTSDTHLNHGYGIDLQVYYHNFSINRKNKNHQLYVSGGYQYAYLDYTISNTNQYSPSGLSYSGLMPGTTMTYTFEHHMPYATIGYRFLPHGMLFDIQLGVSPWVRTYDDDNHIHRGKQSTASAIGHGWLATIEVNLPIIQTDRHRIMIISTLMHVSTTTTGQQKQVYYRDYQYQGYDSTTGSFETKTGVAGDTDFIDYQANTRWTTYDIGLRWLF